MHGHSQWDTLTRRLDASDGGAINVLEYEMVPASRLRDGDLVLYAAGDVISASGEVIEGAGSLGDREITGGSPRITRASGAERSVVASGMRMLSGWIVVRATSGGRRAISGR